MSVDRTKGLPDLALQRTRSAVGAGFPRSRDYFARVSLAGQLLGAAERGRYLALEASS